MTLIPLLEDLFYLGGRAGGTGQGSGVEGVTFGTLQLFGS